MSHVPPPQVDAYGYGFRVPAILVSPYARHGVVDGTELDFASILRFIEDNWSLEPLAERDARANSFVGAFDFTAAGRGPVFLPAATAQAASTKEAPRGLILRCTWARWFWARDWSFVRHAPAALHSLCLADSATSIRPNKG